MKPAKMRPGERVGHAADQLGHPIQPRAIHERGRTRDGLDDDGGDETSANTRKSREVPTAGRRRVELSEVLCSGTFRAPRRKLETRKRRATARLPGFSNNRNCSKSMTGSIWKRSSERNTERSAEADEEMERRNQQQRDRDAEWAMQAHLGDVVDEVQEQPGRCGNASSSGAGNEEGPRHLRRRQKEEQQEEQVVGDAWCAGERRFHRRFIKNGDTV